LINIHRGLKTSLQVGSLKKPASPM